MEHYDNNISIIVNETRESLKCVVDDLQTCEDPDMLRRLEYVHAVLAYSMEQFEQGFPYM